MIRKLIWNFKKSISERAAPKRYNLQIPIIISFEACKNTGKKNAATANLSVRGETKDLSNSGMAFIVPSIRLKEYYLVGENRTLDAELNLPGGKIKMRIVGHRYEQLIDEHASTNSYLIGASIVEISSDERKIYQDFLRSEGKTELNAGTLKLEVDKS